MLRYINHALSFQSAETLRTIGSPKRRNETPNPKVREVTTWRTMKKGANMCLIKRYLLPQSFTHT